MMTNLARWLLVLLVGFAHSYPTTSLPKYPRATIASGEIIGTTTQLSSVPTAVANKFLGIPFAKSPPQRFSLPEDVQPWTSPLMATEFKPSCIQQFTFEFLRNIENNPPLPDSEDCLYLNVFVPASPPPPGGRPIMFWIYGGAFQFGSARLDMYDGSALAVNGDVVVVTANYRMNGMHLNHYSRPQLTKYSIWLPNIPCHPARPTQRWALRPAQSSCLGQPEYPRFRR